MSDLLSDPYIQLLTDMKFVEAVYYLLADQTGNFGILAMYFAIFAHVWLKNYDMVIPTVLGILLGGLIFEIAPPEAQFPAYVLVAFGVASGLYRVFKS